MRAELLRANSPYPWRVCAGIVQSMSETPESTAKPATEAAQTRYDERGGGPSRLGQVLAWVGIITGVVFVVAVIFVSGFFLSWSLDGHYGQHHGHDGGRDGTCPMMGPGGKMGSGGMMGPGGPMGPRQTPTVTTPATPRP